MTQRKIFSPTHTTNTALCGPPASMRGSGPLKPSFGLSGREEAQSSQSPNNSAERLLTYPHNEHRVEWATRHPRTLAALRKWPTQALFWLEWEGRGSVESIS